VCELFGADHGCCDGLVLATPAPTPNSTLVMSTYPGSPPRRHPSRHPTHHKQPDPRPASNMCTRRGPHACSCPHPCSCLCRFCAARPAGASGVPSSSIRRYAYTTTAATWSQLPSRPMSKRPSPACLCMPPLSHSCAPALCIRLGQPDPRCAERPPVDALVVESPIPCLPHPMSNLRPSFLPLPVRRCGRHLPGVLRLPRMLPSFSKPHREGQLPLTRLSPFPI